MDKRINVLLIDDDPSSNFIATTVLQRLDITNTIKTARNGQEGLSYILRRPGSGEFIAPQLIILDKKMPVMNAEEFVEALQNLAFVNRKEIVILLISSSFSQEDHETFNKMGVTEFVTKPLTTIKMSEIYNKYFQYQVGSLQQAGM